MSASAMLPEQFKELERLVAWALPTERERSVKRLGSDYADIKDTYDTLLPRIDEMLEYLNAIPLDAMPDDAQRLLHLTLALAEVAPAVEFFGQPSVIDGFDPARFTIYQ